MASVLATIASITLGAAVTGGFFSLGAVAAQKGLKAVEKKITAGNRNVRENKNPFPESRFVPRSQRRELLKEIKQVEAIK